MIAATISNVRGTEIECVAVSRALAMGEARQVRSPFGVQLDVIREMLLSMDELPSAGQRYTMTKIVAFVAERIRRGGLAVSRQNEAMLTELLEHLTRESNRLMPDARHFNQCAEDLVDLLGPIALDVTA